MIQDKPGSCIRCLASWAYSVNRGLGLAVVQADRTQKSFSSNPRVPFGSSALGHESCPLCGAEVQLHISTRYERQAWLCIVWWISLWITLWIVPLRSALCARRPWDKTFPNDLQHVAGSSSRQLFHVKHEQRHTPRAENCRKSPCVGEFRRVFVEKQVRSGADDSL